MKRLSVLSALALLALLSACSGFAPRPTDVAMQREPDRRLPPDASIASAIGKGSWADVFQPDFVPINMRVCRSPEGYHVRWEVLVTLQNRGGNQGINSSQAPIDVSVNLDPNRPYSKDNTTGATITLGQADPEKLLDYPEQQWMSVPRAGNFGGSAFTVFYADAGPGAWTRLVPTRFTATLDQYRRNNPPKGTITEANEGNNGLSVQIDRYDEINGATATYLIWCWYAP